MKVPVLEEILYVIKYFNKRNSSTASVAISATINMCVYEYSDLCEIGFISAILWDYETNINGEISKADLTKTECSNSYTNLFFYC